MFGLLTVFMFKQGLFNKAGIKNVAFQKGFRNNYFISKGRTIQPGTADLCNGKK